MRDIYCSRLYINASPKPYCSTELHILVVSFRLALLRPMTLTSILSKLQTTYFGQIILLHNYFVRQGGCLRRQLKYDEKELRETFHYTK
jgi:hypothetical protein